MTQTPTADQGQQKPSPLRWALMGDVPAVLDSIWRRVEFYMYRPGGYDCDNQQPLGSRLTYTWRRPANSMVFMLYALLSVFVVIGPTIDTFCGLGGEQGLTAIKVVVSLIALRVAYLVFMRFRSAARGRLAWRFRSDGPAAAYGSGDNADPSRLGLRKRVAMVALSVIGIGASLPPLILVFGLLFSSTGPSQCIGNEWVWPTVLQLLLIIAIAVAAALVLHWLRRADRDEQQYGHASLYCFIWMVALWALAIGALLPWAMQSEAREATPGPYVQTAWFAMGALMLIVAWARWFVKARMAALPTTGVTDLRGAISSTRLLNVLEDETPPPKGRGWAALITGIGMRPLQVLLLPAFFAITVPRSWIWGFVALGLALSGFASTYGTLRERWHQVVSGIERWFFVGLPLPVSIVVIVLGVLRLLNEQYVSTILEAAPIGTIFTGVMIAYLMAWFFEVWINRWLAEAVLKRLGATPKQAALGAMEIDSAGHANQDWQVAKPLMLYVHGPGRIGVEGWHERLKDGVVQREERFANYTFVELFRTLIGKSDDDRTFINEMQRQVRVYFYSINALVVVAVGALLYWHWWASEPAKMQPVIRATTTDTGVDLAAKLTGSSEPALIVAASGGGTRAALYTAYALQGLHSIDQARNVVLISGVSGGGAAAAAFVQRFNTLTAAENSASDHNADPWQAYRQGLTEPFISDVLDGINELRIAGSVAMGQLLAESMQRRLFGTATFASIEPTAPALILNSTISGHPVRDSQLLNQRAAWQDGSDGCDSGRRAFGSLAGSRMVYTTLGRNSFAMPTVAGAPDVRFDFRVINDATTSLAAAAALNANFPPVFPNARVDIARPVDRCGDHSDTYYVTDGGATENLGLISALVALDNTLQGLSAAAWSSLRPLHLIAIEASAMDYEYTQDRGIGAATGGSKERIAGGLTQLLLHKINQSLEQHQRPKLEVSFLPLPLAFRSRGGFGTHWMYAQTIKVTNPLRDEIPAWYKIWKSCGTSPCRVTLHQDDIAALWSGLFRKGGGFCKNALSQAKNEALIVQRWVCGGALGSDAVIDGDQTSGKHDWQVDEWERLVQMLGA